MLLLIALSAAIISTLIWYISTKARSLHISLLVFMFWGASLMWFVDAVFEYMELGAAYFQPAAADMLNDTFLGMSVVVLAMLIWIVYLLIKDPNKVVKKAI
jgi:hypothetical protein